MRMIDADALEPHEQLEPMGNGQYEYVEVVYKDDIDDAPTIDAVPVVRCKDCKHRPFDGEDTQGFGVEFPDGKCPCQCDDGWYSWRPNNEWFCANAERRSDGTD